MSKKKELKRDTETVPPAEPTEQFDLGALDKLIPKELKQALFAKVQETEERIQALEAAINQMVPVFEKLDVLMKQYQPMIEKLRAGQGQTPTSAGPATANPQPGSNPSDLMIWARMLGLGPETPQDQFTAMMMGWMNQMVTGNLQLQSAVTNLVAKMALGRKEE